MQVFLNGSFVDLDSAKVPALDAGLQHAVGLFETMLGGVQPDGGTPWVIDLDRHCERLVSSAAELGLSPDLRATGLADAVIATLQRNPLPRARIKLTVTGGDLNLLARGALRAQGQGAAPARVDPTLLITVQPATVYPQAMLDAGVSVTVATARANNFDPTQGHKTLNYWWRLRELQAAGRSGAAEALVFDVTGRLASGCVSNVFVVKAGTVTTPVARGQEHAGPGGPADDPHTGTAAPASTTGAAVLPSPVLPGITRQWAIDQLELRGSAARRADITASALLDADEVFLTNSSWGVLPVVRLDQHTIGQGRPGTVTSELINAWHDGTCP